MRIPSDASENLKFNQMKNLFSKVKKANASRLLMTLVVVTSLIITVWGCYLIINQGESQKADVYKCIGFILVMFWITVFLCYFIWALYYYNLNYGLTNEEWNKIKEAKNNRSKGLPYNPKDIEAERDENPYRYETFGLPPGTVRGMIAFTLLFGALALLIVSFGLNSEIVAGSFFQDNFDFFKTAFLMMVAFYFGTRGLQILKNSNASQTTDNGGSNKDNSGKTSSESENNSEQQSIVTDVLKNAVQKTIVIQPEDAKPTVTDGIENIMKIDPMRPK